MIAKDLKFINLIYTPENKTLRLYGDNKFVKGEIFIRYQYLYTVFCFISRVFRLKKK